MKVNPFRHKPNLYIYSHSDNLNFMFNFSNCFNFNCRLQPRYITNRKDIPEHPNRKKLQIYLKIYFQIRSWILLICTCTTVIYIQYYQRSVWDVCMLTCWSIMIYLLLGLKIWHDQNTNFLLAILWFNLL